MALEQNGSGYGVDSASRTTSRPQASPLLGPTGSASTSQHILPTDSRARNAYRTIASQRTRPTSLVGGWPRTFSSPNTPLQDIPDGQRMPSGQESSSRSDLANWQNLHDLVNEGALDDTTLDPQKQPRRQSSRQSLSSVFGSSWSGVGRVTPVDIRPPPGQTELGPPMILSSSPPAMASAGPLSLAGESDVSNLLTNPRHSSTPLGNSHSPFATLSNPPTETLRVQSTKQKCELRDMQGGQVTDLSSARSYWPPSPAAIAIFKCSLAYLLASLFTFVPYLANVLSTSSETDAHGRVTRRPAYSAHMVATVVVYFNPARTMGSMVLSSRYCFILAMMAAVASLGAIGTIHVFDVYSPTEGDEWDWVSEMGDWLVCVVWIGGSMGLLAWSKVWVGNANYNTGCSMAAVTLFTVVIKEGGVPKLLEVLMIVLIGACITNLVNYTVFPSSATSRLQTSISKSLSSFSFLLDLLTSTFLLERAVIKESKTTLKSAVDAHASAFKTLKADLAEAKHERVLDSRIRGSKLHLYEAAIGSLTRLAQHLSGLRQSTGLQESLIRAAREGRISLDLYAEKGHLSESMVQRFVEEEPGLEPSRNQDVDVATSVKLFLSFRNIAGTQMDTLVVSNSPPRWVGQMVNASLQSHCDAALDAVQEITQKHPSEVDISGIRSSLSAALRDFTESSSTAIKRLYAGPKRERGVYHISDDGDHSESEEPLSANLDQEEEGPNETVFLIYFFLFTFEEFARELLFLLETVIEISESESPSAWNQIKTLILPAKAKKSSNKQFPHKQLSGSSHAYPPQADIILLSEMLVPIDPSNLQPSLFPSNPKHTPGTLLTPQVQSLTGWERTKQLFWRVGARMRQPDIRYAVKVGVASAMLAAPAYTEVGRPIFLEYRGEWALISFFSTMNPTLGQTNFVSIYRILGTILGAAVAVLFYSLFPENPVVLPILGFLFSIPCFWIITQRPMYAQAGRFILLAYVSLLLRSILIPDLTVGSLELNLSIRASIHPYNQRDRDLTTVEIGLRRSTSVIVGVVWAAVVSRYWWPFTARRELRMGLCDFFLDLSYLYSKLVVTYSRGVETATTETFRGDDDEQSPLLPTTTSSPHISLGVRHFMAMELHLQTQLSSLRGLLEQTKNEPRLKGPFAFDLYKEVLLSCERMVDRLHSMRCVTTRDEWDDRIQKDFVEPVNKERREMVGNVILYFYTISAGFKLRTPMPPFLPPAEQARQNLVASIRNLDVVKRRSVRGGGRHLLFFAYALAMQEVIAELDYLGGLLQDAFGVISQSTVLDFEVLFESPPGELA
ncbi:hypothetical protein P7C73_g4513, partial [Tremellales sp. Uapishka_1]